MIDNQHINLIVSTTNLTQPLSGIGQYTFNLAQELLNPDQAGKFLGLNVSSKHLMPIFLR